MRMLWGSFEHSFFFNGASPKFWLNVNIDLPELLAFERNYIVPEAHFFAKIKNPHTDTVGLLF